MTMGKDKVFSEIFTNVSKSQNTPIAIAGVATEQEKMT